MHYFCAKINLGTKAPSFVERYNYIHCSYLGMCFVRGFTIRLMIYI